MSNYKIRYSDELYHHGIKGQQWGVRNGPPYPLERETLQRYYRGEMSSDERKVFEKDLYTSEKFKTRMQNARKLDKQLSKLRNDSPISETSSNASKAFSEYCKNNNIKNPTETDKYGFFHYEWGRGNKYYDQGLKEYKQQTKELSNELENILESVGKDIVSTFPPSYMNKKLAGLDSTYLEEAKFWASQALFRDYLD